MAQATKLQTRRINAGIYELTDGQTVWELKAFGRGDWLLFAIINGTREYIRDFWTKRDAQDFLTGALA